MNASAKIAAAALSHPVLREVEGVQQPAHHAYARLRAPDVRPCVLADSVSGRRQAGRFVFVDCLDVDGSIDAQPREGIVATSWALETDGDLVRFAEARIYGASVHGRAD